MKFWLLKIFQVTLRRIRDEQKPLFASNLTVTSIFINALDSQVLINQQTHLKSTTCVCVSVLTIILRIMVELIPIPNCHTTLSTPKNASGPQNTTGNVTRVFFLSLLSSPQSHHLHCLPLEDEGWVWVFFLLYTSVSHSHLCPKFPRSAAVRGN